MACVWLIYGGFVWFGNKTKLVKGDMFSEKKINIQNFSEKMWVMRIKSIPGVFKVE